MLTLTVLYRSKARNGTKSLALFTFTLSKVVRTMTDNMKHVMEARGNILVITLEGEFHKDAPDYFKTIASREPLLQPWTFRQFERVVFDLSKVRSMSSNGIGILIIVKTMAKKAGHTEFIAIAGANKRVERVLVNTQIASMFELFDTVEQALGVSQQ